MDTIVINLGDPQTRQVAFLLALSWGVGVAIVFSNLASDITSLLRSRKPKRKAVERRFIEPCAEALHAYEAGACTHCKAVQPDPSP